MVTVLGGLPDRRGDRFASLNEAASDNSRTEGGGSLPAAFARQAAARKNGTPHRCVTDAANQ